MAVKDHDSASDFDSGTRHRLEQLKEKIAREKKRYGINSVEETLKDATKNIPPRPSCGNKLCQYFVSRIYKLCDDCLDHYGFMP